METNDIEKIFKEKLVNLEEIPSEGLWEKVALTMPDYSSATQVSFVENISQSLIKAGKIFVQTKGIVIAVGTSVTLIGSLLIYNANTNNKPTESSLKNNSIIINHVNSQENGTISQKQEQQDYNKATGITEKVLVNNLPKTKLVKAESQPEEEVNPSEIKKENPMVAAKSDSVNVAEPESLVKSEKKSEKVESFYEKKSRQMKDSTRSVFKPE